MKDFTDKVFEEFFPETTRQKIDYMYDVIQKCESTIEHYRTQCTHPAFRVGLYSYRVGACNPERLCVECDRVLPGITEDERLECWKNQNIAVTDGEKILIKS